MNICVTLILMLVKCSSLFAAVTNHLDKPQRQGRIVGGQEAKPHSHPYLVSLQKRLLWMRLHTCGGALLNKYWILSAGHCVHENWLTSWLPMDAVAGAHEVDNIGPQSQVVTVTQRIVHPLYNGDVGPHDIALIRTSPPFTFTNEIQPVKLPEASKEVSDTLTLPGWGVLKSTIFFPDFPGKLQEVSVTHISYKACYKAIEGILEDGDVNPLDQKSNICTGPLTGGISGCSGDSGGPLVQYMTRKQYYNTKGIRTNNVKNGDDKVAVVLGVVSWTALPCGIKGSPTVYTKVSNYLDFINFNMNKIQ